MRIIVKEVVVVALAVVSFTGVAFFVRTRKNPRTKAHSALWPYLLFSCLLLASLSAYVVALMPTKSPDQAAQWVPMHQRLRNFLVAEKLAAGLVTAPITRWSGPIQCGPLQNGIWYAEGAVGVETGAGQENGVSWRAIFIPETSQFLYLSVGSVEKGDLKEAIQRSGIHLKNP